LHVLRNEGPWCVGTTVLATVAGQHGVLGGENREGAREASWHWALSVAKANVTPFRPG